MVHPIHPIHPVRTDLIEALDIFLIVSFLMLAVKYGEGSVFIPIANRSFVVAMLASALLHVEPITPRKVLSMLFADSAIVALTLASGPI